MKSWTKKYNSLQTVEIKPTCSTEIDSNLLLISRSIAGYITSIEVEKATKQKKVEIGHRSSRPHNFASNFYLRRVVL
jgi:hypothetical protein